MCFSSLSLFGVFYRITGNIRYEMLDSLDDQKIAEERAYLIALASSS
jgi:hypothetical protein